MYKRQIFCFTFPILFLFNYSLTNIPICLSHYCTGVAIRTLQGNLKFAFVAVEYFTKWIEARAVSTITSKTAQKFFWQNIVCRFGVPSELTVDNDKQFDSQDFKEFYFSIGTKLTFQYTTRSPTELWSAQTEKFSQLSRRCSSTKKKADGPIYYRRQSGR